MSTRKVFCVILSLSVFLGMCYIATAKSLPTDAEMPGQQALKEDEIKELNNQIRRDKFDLLLPQVMRERNIDMWIHVMREDIPDPFGAGEFGSKSGVFVFTDRGGDRIERAVLGRRWGVTQREVGEVEIKGLQPSSLVEESGAYDIIFDPVFVAEPVGSPMTEYDYRFTGLREFVVPRDPKRIAVNFKHDLGPWPTNIKSNDGISHTDYLLLTEELGDKYANRLVSSEYVMTDYITRSVPSEIQLLKRMNKDEVERVKKAFAEIVPGVTKIRGGVRGARVVVFRRMRTGISQRSRAAAWAKTGVIKRGDIVAATGQGMYAYVLREGETEPPPDIKKLWAEFMKIDKIFEETIKVGLTPRQIIKNYTRKFADEGIIIRDNQLHMVQPKNNFAAYSAGFGPEKIHLSVDCIDLGKGARERSSDNYFGPRISSLGPDWTKDIKVPPNNHFFLEYFFYTPSPTNNKREDQYLFLWNNEPAIATERGVKYFGPPQRKLYLIK